MSRVLIAGYPRTGKTTFAAELGGSTGAPVRHTDDLIGAIEWSAASLEVSTWLEDAGPWVIEGVAIPRAIRKYLARNPEGRPADVVYWRAEPREALTPRQQGMGKGCAKVWDEVRDELVRRGVRIEQF